MKEDNRIIEKEKKQELKRRYLKRKKNSKKLLVFFIGLCILLGVVGYIGVKKWDNGKINFSKEESLVIKTEKVDKKSLDKLIKETQAIKKEAYDKDSIAELEKNVDDAKEILKKNPKQNEIEEAYMNLVYAIQKLKTVKK